jgi:signal transduction histidine kinase
VHVTAVDVGTAALWAAAACIAVWLVTLPLRRWSLAGVLASVVLTGTAASIGAVLGSVRAMVLPAREQTTVLVMASAAGVLGALAAGAAARRIARDHRELTEAVADLGKGQVPNVDGRRIGTELGEIRRELRATGERLRESRERERTLESARRELVAWVSHDLRTPLAGLRAVAEALEDGVVDDPHVSYKQIRMSVDRLSTMVDDLFELSRIQAGSFVRDADLIALDDLVSDCLAALDPLAIAQGVRLVGKLVAPVVVVGSGAELNRALTNVVANAIRHTPLDGCVEVAVGRSAATAQGTRAQVTVRDECGGIAAEDLARVFDVGFRGEPARTPHTALPAGAGLGLAITRGIVEAHEGTVNVTNTPGGCRFTISLPLTS